MPRILSILSAVGLVAALTQGCGSSSSLSSAAAGSAATPSGAVSAAAGGSAGALSAEAKSKATGDIPDNQVYLPYHSAADNYTINYPEGWTRQGAGTNVTFSDKNNILHIVIGNGATQTPASVSSELGRLKRSNPTLSFTTPSTIQLKSGPAVKATYTTQSAPNPVTGKSVVLMVDRYELNHAGRHATVDLATPRGVDTVDAYKMIINSFHWQ